MAQGVTAQITDVSLKQTGKGDLFLIQTANGAEYSTFQRGLAEQAHQLKGQTVTLRYTEKHVTKDGRNFTNLYYEGAEVGGQLPVGNVSFGNGAAGSQPMQQLSFPQAPAAPQADTGRELKIMRQTGTKVAAHLMPYLPEAERTPQGLLAMAEYLVGYYQDGIPVPTYGEPGSGFDSPPAPGDEDIPFAPTIDGFQ